VSSLFGAGRRAREGVGGRGDKQHGAPLAVIVHSLATAEHAFAVADANASTQVVMRIDGQFEGTG
jgi:hypothetical protein